MENPSFFSPPGSPSERGLLHKKVVCRLADHFQYNCWIKLLHCFLNRNSHGNGHADHRVVACAQEAHHFHVKSACRRLCACGAGTFGAGSPTFRKTRSTSPESVCCAFPLGLILSHHLFTKQDVLTFLYNSHHHFFIFHHRSSSLIICLSTRHQKKKNKIKIF